METLGQPRPLLFLDVDGVLNVWDPVGPVDRWSFSDGRLLVVPRGMAQRLRQLACFFDVVWATTWGPDAPETFGELLGIGETWSVLDFDDEKWPTIEKVVGERRFAWVDDNADRDVPKPGRPANVLFSGPVTDTGSTGVLAALGDPHAAPTSGAARGLVLTVDPRVGLDDAAAAVLQAFAVDA